MNDLCLYVLWIGTLVSACAGITPGEIHQYEAQIDKAHNLGSEQRERQYDAYLSSQPSVYNYHVRHVTHAGQSPASLVRSHHRQQGLLLNNQLLQDVQDLDSYDKMKDALDRGFAEFSNGSPEESPSHNQVQSNQAVVAQIRNDPDEDVLADSKYPDQADNGDNTNPDEIQTNDLSPEAEFNGEGESSQNLPVAPPAPAALVQSNPNDRLKSLHAVNSMADVYFLGNTGIYKSADLRSEEIYAAEEETQLSTVIFVAVVTGCSIAGLVGLVVAGVCWYRLQKNVKAASDVDYPAYGVTGPTKERFSSASDRKLAQSAQMYHYQHQKQQMIAMEKAQGDLTKDGSDVDTDEDNEEGDYTVFECPGLAPTGEMEVKNPLFSEETPVVTPGGDNQQQK